jgi:hypothetical protein
MNLARKNEWVGPFIEITSDYGCIGNIYWWNSGTMPEKDLWTLTWITYWGAFLPRRPDESICYVTRIPYPRPFSFRDD